MFSAIGTASSVNRKLLASNRRAIKIASRK